MQLTIKNTKKDIVVPSDKTILDVLRLEYGITSPCGGKGICGKCKVKVLAKQTDSQWKEVLACQTGDVFAVDATELVSKATASAMIQANFETNNSRFLKDSNWKGCSIAIDVGTTTLVVALVNTENGVVDKISALNPQSSFGSDVISRILYSSKNTEAKQQIQKVLVIKLAEMIETLLSGRKEVIDCIQIVGNPTMIYLLAGIDAQELGVAPYTVSKKEPFCVNSVELGFPYSVPVYFPGSVSAFFGSDITCGMVASIEHLTSESFIYADLGTNGEIAVSDGKRILCCSTAVGPAFEGANISCGIGAIEGAVNHVKIHGDKVSISTINNKKPIGICGSGIIDTVSEMLQNNLIDFSGRIEDSVSQPFELYEGLTFEQKDIREVQLAKSAFRTGIEVLMNILKIDVKSIARVYIAGGFGSFIDIENCKKIGMFPEIDSDRFVSLGNAAAKGAVSMVHSEKFSIEVDNLRKNMEYIELFDSKDFQQKYIEFMTFGEEIFNE